MKSIDSSLANLVLVSALVFSGGSGVFAGYQPSRSTSSIASNSNNLAAVTLPENTASFDTPEPTLPQGKSDQSKADIASSFGQLPLIFIQNQGQLDSRVAYSLQGQDTSIYFSSSGLTFSLSDPITDTAASSLSTALYTRNKPQNLDNSPAKTGRWTLKLDFLGANPGVIPQGEDKAKTVVSYFKGSPDQWHTGLPTFRRLVYHDLWPGIDLVYSGTSNRLKYEFIVEPGADPMQIRLAYHNLNALKLDLLGGMEVSTPFRTIYDEAPVVFQVSGGKQVPVAVNYKLQSAEPSGSGLLLSEVDSASAAALGYSFQVSDYDPALPLVIDPAILVYCGFLGGTGDDSGKGIAVDDSGAAYVTGWTNSDQSTFPVTVGHDLTYNGGLNGLDAFVIKVRPDGTGLAYAGYIGGSGDDTGLGIAVDGSGAAYVTGETNSDANTFPVASGPDLKYSGSTDAFVAKVSPDGTGLVYCGYIGGSDYDVSDGIAVDGSGAAYVTGYTKSSNTTFPVSVGPHLVYNGGYYDAFVAKVRADGSGLVYAGYIGGSGVEWGNGIAVDGNGAAYVVGWTNSDQSTFPVRSGPDLTYNGGTDAFVAKVRPNGAGFVYVGYIGGSNYDAGSGIALDTSGAVYVTGYATSDQTTFPVSGGPDLDYNGYYDAFVAKLRPDGTGLVYAGYIGGSGYDWGYGIAVDESGAAYVTGKTGSSSNTFPVTDGPDSTFNGGEDAFVTKVSPDGSELVYSGYIGGSKNDWSSSIAVDQDGAAYVTGWTDSTAKTFPVRVGPGQTYNGGLNGLDAFVAKIAVELSFYLPFIQR
jgi:hypothetical protein